MGLFVCFGFHRLLPKHNDSLELGDFGSWAVGFYFEKALKLCLAASLDSSEQLVEKHPS